MPIIWSVSLNTGMTKANSMMMILKKKTSLGEHPLRMITTSRPKSNSTYLFIQTFSLLKSMCPNMRIIREHRSQEVSIRIVFRKERRKRSHHRPWIHQRCSDSGKKSIKIMKIFPSYINKSSKVNLGTYP